jgi:peptide deformylase
MAILPIRMYPDPVLREAAPPVTKVDESVLKLISDMTETMHAAPGVGLAAPQVGVQRRVFVYRPSMEDPVGAFVNPKIVERSGEDVDEEGCLSIPGLSYPVVRAQRILVRGLDGAGEALEVEAEDYVARILQHEIDHLDGVLFIDRIDPDLRREALRLIRERAVNGSPTPVPRTLSRGTPPNPPATRL